MLATYLTYLGKDCHLLVYFGRDAPPPHCIFVSIDLSTYLSMEGMATFLRSYLGGDGHPPTYVGGDGHLHPFI